MQQLLQSVHSAVQLGLLPAQAVNPQTLSSPNFVVNVRQLLQLHQHHKMLVQSMQQQPPPTPGTTLAQQHQQQRLMEYAANGLQQQIEQLKQQILQMASGLPPQSSVSASPSMDTFKSLAGMQGGKDDSAASRLISQWKMSDTEAGSSGGGGITGMNAFGVKSAQHSLEDSTWMPLSTTSSAWSASSPSELVTTSTDNKLSQTSASMTSTSGGSSSSSEAAGPALDIEEFIPGKLWQGPSTKNVEDDPYITPGSITRNSLSTINDVQAMNILGKSNPSPSVGDQRSMSTGISGSSASLNSSAVAGVGNSGWGNDTRQQLPSDLWSRDQTALPPGLNVQNKVQWNSNFNRSISWAPGDRSEIASSESYDSVFLLLTVCGFVKSVLLISKHRLFLSA